MSVAARRSHGFWVSLIAWTNFILLIMAVMKFIPLMMSLCTTKLFGSKFAYNVVLLDTTSPNAEQ